MKTRYTDKDVHDLLKDADRFNKNGINFLRCRLNGGEGDHAKKTIDSLNDGKLEVPEKLKKEVMEAYGYIPSPEGLAVVLLGRAPTGVKDGSKVGSTSSTPTEAQIAVATKLAKAVSDGHLYVNRVRLSKDKVPSKDTKVETPVTAETKAKEVAKAPAKAPASAKAKAPASKEATA